MVDIRAFFGPGGKKATPKKKSDKSAPAKRPATITIPDDDDDDDEEKELVQVRDTKRRKTEEPKKSNFFEEKPKSKKKVIKDDEDDYGDDDFVVNDDDFEDDDDQDEEMKDEEYNGDNDEDDFVEIVEKKEPRSSRKKEVKAEPKKEPVVTPSPKKAVKKPIPKKTTVKQTPAKSNTGVTAMDILSKIPDAELPEEISTGEGFNFRDFKARQSTLPSSSGAIEIPEGAPNCLTGLTMVFTGVMPNIAREDAEGLAKKYGAKVTKSISSKTSVVVLGEEAGPSKVKKIKQFKIKAIDENGFIQLVKGMPEEGGDGDAAEKARAKRAEEEEKALEESLRLEEEAEQEAKKREEAIKKAQKSGRAASSSSLKTDAEKLWTVRYAPTKLEQLCGNKGTVQKLRQWLETWPEKFGNRKPAKGETDMRAVLIHGPPGIGKTTAAHLVAKSLGYDVIEKNASDVRSKNLLSSNIGGVLNNSSVVGFFNKDKQEVTSENNSKFCIIMDEVDGMSGGDRGGVGQLATFCRKTQAPMILICNDKSLPKMRPFDRVTLDLPFRRPSAKEMKSRLMTIALREKIKLDPNVIDQLVAATSNDIRQIINLLSTVSKTQNSIDSSNTKGITAEWQKNIALKIFDIIPRLFSGQLYLENSNVPLYKKIEYYFDDHAFVPLMIQENYLNTRPNKASSKLGQLELIANAAESISAGDIIDAKIHSAEQQWSLMPLHAVMSTVRPASMVAGQLAGRVNFSAWLGQNSKTGKYYRYLTEIQYRSRLRTSTSQTELRLEYIPVLTRRLLDPLVASADNIPEIVEILDHYYLSKADWDILMEFPIGDFNTTATLKKIPSGTKSKFTRKYNSTSHPVSIYRPGVSTGVTKATKDKPDFDDVVESDPEPEEDLSE